VEQFLIKTTIQSRSMLQDGYKACLFTPSIFLTHEYLAGSLRGVLGRAWGYPLGFYQTR
jgi:hypothetical protein